MLCPENTATRWHFRPEPLPLHWRMVPLSEPLFFAGATFRELPAVLFCAALDEGPAAAMPGRTTSSAAIVRAIRRIGVKARTGRMLISRNGGHESRHSCH